MALLADKIKNDGSLHAGVVPASTAGEFVFNVSSGRRATIVVDNSGGATFNLIFYNMTESEAAVNSITRVKGLDTAAITQSLFSRSTVAGVRQVGIEVTNAVATELRVEVLESKV